MKKTRKLRIVCAALAVFVTVAALLPGISGTDALAVSQSQIDALEEQRDALRAEREEMQAGIDELESQQADVLQQKAALDAQNEVYRQEIELIEEQVSLYTQRVEQKGHPGRERAAGHLPPPRARDGGKRAIHLPLHPLWLQEPGRADEQPGHDRRNHGGRSAQL